MAARSDSSRGDIMTTATVELSPMALAQIEEIVLAHDREREAEDLEDVGRAGILDKIPNWKIIGLPVGEVVKGGIAAAVGDTAGTLLIRFLPGGLSASPYAPAILKLGAAALLQWKPVKGVLGSDAAAVGTLLLTYEGVMSLFNLRAKAYGMLTGLTAGFTGGGTTQTPAPATPTSGVTTFNI